MVVEFAAPSPAEHACREIEERQSALNDLSRGRTREREEKEVPLENASSAKNAGEMREAEIACAIVCNKKGEQLGNPPHYN
jgi:hypothetical protein